MSDKNHTIKTHKQILSETNDAHSVDTLHSSRPQMTYDAVLIEIFGTDKLENIWKNASFL